ncbi:MAG TPA: Ig-like domain-containing protein [Gammaproteobacteria bacterium]|jgi:hypothetical protein
MRKIIVLCGLCLVSATALLFYGCGGGGGAYGGGGGGTTGSGGGSTGIATQITIAPSNATVTVSGMQTFTAISKDANGNTLTGVPLVWNSSDPSIATIDSSGTATGMAVGTTSITASVTYTSSGAYTTGMGTTYTSNMATLHVATMSDVMGVVATGRALAGAVVTLKDATGKSQTGMSDAQGHFQLSVAGMQGPFLVRADDGRGRSLFGATAAAGVANVDTLTDLMLRAFYSGRGGTPEQAFADMGAHPAPDAKTLQALDRAFGKILRDSLAAEGLDPDSFNLFATPFTATGTGFDAVLDNTRAMTGRALEMQDGLMERSTEIRPGAGGLVFTTRGAGMQDVMQKMALP